jgi:hypothetical protein
MRKALEKTRSDVLGTATFLATLGKVGGGREPVREEDSNDSGSLLVFCHEFPQA